MYFYIFSILGKSGYKLPELFEATRTKAEFMSTNLETPALRF